jgi:hypothetical protein
MSQVPVIGMSLSIVIGECTRVGLKLREHRGEADLANPSDVDVSKHGHRHEVLLM